MTSTPGRGLAIARIPTIRGHSPTGPITWLTAGHGRPRWASGGKMVARSGPKSGPRKLWEPSERAVEEAQLTQFARQMVRKRRLELNSYADLYRWSVECPEEFWPEVWDFCGVISSRKGSTV